jgi:uncharacterized protein
MKKILTVLCAFIMLSACNSSKDESAENIKKYKAVWENVYKNRNLDAFNLDNYHEDARLITGPVTLVGIDSIKAYYNNYLTGFSNGRLTINEIIGQGDRLVMYWTFKGNHSGEFFGVPATGKDINLQGVTLIRMRDGKIAEEQDFVDNLDLMDQMGLIP